MVALLLHSRFYAYNFRLVVMSETSVESQSVLFVKADQPQDVILHLKKPLAVQPGDAVGFRMSGPESLYHSENKVP